MTLATAFKDLMNQNMILITLITFKDHLKFESDFDEEEYWYTVEQERYKDQLEDFEESEEKEHYKNIYENLKEEYGANMSNEEHDFIMNITLNIIKEFEIQQETELDDESFKKMICNIYPQVCETLFKRKT